MAWPDDVAGALPAPRDDEPPDLRRKIIAELRDHLQTAVQRELLLTGDAVQAETNVLARFGDPVRLARKLWFDAMWEKIMVQRWMLAALVVMVLVSVSSMGLTWFMVVQAGQVNQALLEQSRSANEMLLNRLNALGGRPASPQSTELVPLKVKLSTDQPGGAPAAGFRLILMGGPFDGRTMMPLQRTTGADGIADFGLIGPGEYLVDVHSPWGESVADVNALGIARLVEVSGLLISVLPGEEKPHEVVVPSQPGDAEISLTVDWPEQLADQGLWLVSDFLPAPREIAGHKWGRPDSGPRFIVVDPRGQLTDPPLPDFWGPQGGMVSFPRTESFASEQYAYYVTKLKSFADAPGIYHFVGNRRSANAGANPAPAPLEEDVHPPFEPAPERKPRPPYLWLPRSTAAPRLKWPAGRYSVAHIAIGRDSSPQDPPLPDDALHPEFLGSIEFGAEGTFKLLYPNERQARAGLRPRPDDKATAPQFDALPGRANEWRLSLPKPLVELLTAPKPPPAAAVPVPVEDDEQGSS